MSSPTVALLLGGNSPEREVSLMSGAGVAEALQRCGVAFMSVDPATERNWLNVLAQNNIRQVLNILHGGGGENGEVYGALASVGIACSGSDVLGSALAMNKHISKQLWRAIGIPTADWRLAQTAADAEAIAADLPPPWFVKPVSGGSSTHSAMVQSAAELPAAINHAAAEAGGALVEALITDADEYTLSIVDNRPLPLIKIVPAHSFYDYHAKYESDETGFFCPCGLGAAQEAALAEQGMTAFRALQCAHWGRVDFMLRANGEPMFLEVNTVPGMTSHSLVPCAAKQAGLSYDDVVLAVLKSAQTTAAGDKGEAR